MDLELGSERGALVSEERTLRGSRAGVRAARRFGNRLSLNSDQDSLSFIMSFLWSPNLDVINKSRGLIPGGRRLHV